MTAEELKKEFLEDYYRHPQQPVISTNTRSVTALLEYVVDVVIPRERISVLCEQRERERGSQSRYSN